MSTSQTAHRKSGPIFLIVVTFQNFCISWSLIWRHWNLSEIFPCRFHCYPFPQHFNHLSCVLDPSLEERNWQTRGLWQTEGLFVPWAKQRWTCRGV